MTKKAIIGAILFGLGLLVCAGAVGHLDYLNVCKIAAEVGEIWAALGKGAIGLVLMAAGMFAARNEEFEEDDEMLIRYGDVYFDDVTGDVYDAPDEECGRDWDDECDRFREERDD